MAGQNTTSVLPTPGLYTPPVAKRGYTRDTIRGGASDWDVSRPFSSYSDAVRAPRTPGPVLRAAAEDPGHRAPACSSPSPASRPRSSGSSSRGSTRRSSSSSCRCRSPWCSPASTTWARSAAGTVTGSPGGPWPIPSGSSCPSRPCPAALGAPRRAVLVPLGLVKAQEVRGSGHVSASWSRRFWGGLALRF